MRAPERSEPFSPNPKPVKRGCRMISLRTGAMRIKTYEIDRLADKAGQGSRDRLNEALIKSAAILDEAVKREERFINATRSHEDRNGARQDSGSRLDVVA